MNNYYINCDLGDTIYSLIILKRSNKGGFYFGPSHSSSTTKYEEKNKLLYDLLEYQDYITSFGYCNKLFWREYHYVKNHNKEDHKIHKVFFNKKKEDPMYVNKVPNLFWDSNGVEMTATPLVELISERFGLESSFYKEPWISIPDKVLHDKKIIINRTMRYLSNQQLYADIINSHGSNNCGFIGTEIEYKNFCNTINIKIDYIKTENLLDAAIAIKNSNFFVGNQSSCMALAEALKHNTVQETFPNIPNCLFTYRENFYAILPGSFFNLGDKHVGISLKNGQIGNIIFKDFENYKIKNIKLGLKEYTIRSIII